MAKTPLSFTERNKTKTIFCNLALGLFDDKVTAITVKTDTGLLIADVNTLEEFNKEYSRYIRKNGKHQVIIQYKDEEYDVSGSIHTPGFEIYKICDGTVRKD